VRRLSANTSAKDPAYTWRVGSTESWDDKQTDVKHFRDLVYVDRIEFLDSRGPGNGHRDPAESTFEESTVTDQEMPF
jgi:hypothetical protein